MLITCKPPASSRDPDHTLPPDLDPEIYPIIAKHYFGMELPNLRPSDVLWRAA